MNKINSSQNQHVLFLPGILSCIVQTLWVRRTSYILEDRTVLSVAHIKVWEDYFIGPCSKISSFLFSTEE